jgi:hypothetical protein
MPSCGALSNAGAHQQQAGDVDAGDQQDATDRGQQQQRRAQVLVQREHRNQGAAPAAIRRRIFALEIARDQIEFRLRLGTRDAGREPREAAD